MRKGQIVLRIGTIWPDEHGYRIFLPAHPCKLSNGGVFFVYGCGPLRGCRGH